MRVLKAIGRVIFWTYARGTWQYDLLCALILVFIFLTPRDFFSKPPFYSQDDRQKLNEEKERQDGKERPVSVRLSV
ncbi:MAG: hypothetical protein EHM61_12040 [Acidobacteria bacterium]|nr:MAG: hypothetical protein EHM61_12040 [Acidobacteriota bacterium]